MRSAMAWTRPTFFTAASRADASLNGHQVYGIEGFEQRKAAVPPLVVVQHATQSFDRARRQGAGWLLDVCVTH